MALPLVGLALRANLAALGRGATASRPFANRHPNLQRLPRVGLALRANLACLSRAPLALCTPYSALCNLSCPAPTLDAARIARSAIPTCINLCTFAQAVG